MRASRHKNESSFAMLRSRCRLQRPYQHTRIRPAGLPARATHLATFTRTNVFCDARVFISAASSVSCAPRARSFPSRPPPHPLLSPDFLRTALALLDARDDRAKNAVPDRLDDRAIGVFEPCVLAVKVDGQDVGVDRPIVLALPLERVRVVGPSAFVL